MKWRPRSIPGTKAGRKREAESLSPLTLSSRKKKGRRKTTAARSLEDGVDGRGLDHDD
jgi:hypothetical protein